MSRECELDAEALLQALRAQKVIPRGLSLDSRYVKPGDVFLAWPGFAVDGRDFIGQAIDAGALGVLWERDGYTWDASRTTPNVSADGLSKLAGHLAHVVYGRPSEKLWVVGVTGTNGKTSISQWVSRALCAAGRKCGVVGTLGDGFPGDLHASANTTPDAVSLHRTLARMKEAGAQAVAMEASSIGLDQDRVSGVRFDVAVFSNLTHDHLEYHQTMEAYGAAKARLFDMPGLKSAVINLDDPFGRDLCARMDGRGVERIGYTVGEPKPGVDVLLQASNIDLSGPALRFHVEAGGDRAEVQAFLVGQFNVSNLLAVIGVLISSGFSLEESAQLVSQLTAPPGRMQVIGGMAEPLVVIDYAHTPDALSQVLTALRPSTQSRGGALVCVFGCGGDRDKGKRAMMGEAAAKLADRVIVTSDNPRSEDPQRIIDEILAGAHRAALCTLDIPDREKAIQTAIGTAQPDDVVLIAGKGHETYQEVAGVKHAFSDIAVARAALVARVGGI